MLGTVALVACRFLSAGAKCIVGDAYGKDERDIVKALYNQGTIHVYPATESNGRLKLSNWDHEFNPMSPFEMNVNDILFYFVTEQYLEPIFGMDVDGDSIMLVKASEFDKVGFTQEMVNSARHQLLEKRKSEMDSEYGIPDSKPFYTNLIPDLKPIEHSKEANHDNS